MTWFMVDVETDGPCPGLFSMVSFGVVMVTPGLEHTYYSGVIHPISEQYESEALAISNLSREDHLLGRDPRECMLEFKGWVEAHTKSRPMFISDNNGFDWSFVNYYFHKYLGSNPFGYSSTNLGSLYKGMVKNMRQNFKHLRVTKHTHHPVDDAKGNAEAFLKMMEMGLAPPPENL
jgi:hypothetical protein